MELIFPFIDVGYEWPLGLQKSLQNVMYSKLLQNFSIINT